MAAPASQTSGVGAGLSFTGFQLQAGNGSSPETFTTICNVADFTMPLKADTVDVTNAGDLWRRRISTLLDMGTIKFKIFFQPQEATHENSISGLVRGLRYLLVNQTLVNWKAIYPTATPNSVDYFAAYVTGFNETGKVGDVFTAEIELSNNGAPVLQ
jgi:hypothetical protein